MLNPHEAANVIREKVRQRLAEADKEIPIIRRAMIAATLLDMRDDIEAALRAVQSDQPSEKK